MLRGGAELGLTTQEPARRWSWGRRTSGKPGLVLLGTVGFAPKKHQGGYGKARGLSSGRKGDGMCVHWGGGHPQMSPERGSGAPGTPTAPC